MSWTHYRHGVKVISTTHGAKGKVKGQSPDGSRTLVKWNETKKEEWVDTGSLDPIVSKK